MRFLHVSDTHVGFAAYSRVTPDGLNAREQDFFDAFRRAVDIAVEKRVDFVLHSGDLFDSVRPTNRAISHVLAECRRLHEARIPFIVISGNHEAPRLRETGAVLRLLEFIPGVTAVYKGQTERIRIGECLIHAVPHAADNDALLAQLRDIKRDAGARWNIASFHAGVLGVGDFRTGEFHEQVVPQNEIPQQMDYVALGHYHRAVEIAPKVWYAGSTERCTFKECGETKSVNIVDLARGTVEVHALPSRPMLMLPSLACEGMNEADIAPAVYARLGATRLEGAIARLRVTGIPAHVHATLDYKRIKEMTATAFHFDIQPDIVRAGASGVASAALGELGDEFRAFLDQRALQGDNRSELLSTAQELLREATSEEVAP